MLSSTPFRSNSASSQDSDSELTPWAIRKKKEKKSEQNSVPQLVLCQNCNLAMLSKNHVCTVDYDDDDDNEDDDDHAKCTEHECVFEHGDIRRRDCTVAS